MVGQGGYDPIEGKTSSRQWVLNLLIALCSLFLILTYEAAMTAVLVQDTLVSDYRNIEDLKKCHIPPSEVCVPEGGAIEVFWDDAIATDPCHKGHTPMLVSSYEKGAKRLYKKKCKFMIGLTATGMSLAHGRYCQKVVSTGEPCFLGGLSFLLPRGSKYTEMMSNATLDMQRSGLLPRPENYVKSIGQCPKDSHLSLTLTKLQVFFILAFVACFVIFLEMVLDPQEAERVNKAKRREGDDNSTTGEGSTQGSTEASTKGNSEGTGGGTSEDASEDLIEVAIEGFSKSDEMA